MKAVCPLKIRLRQRRRIIASLGRRPRIREIKTPTALKARFTAETKLDSPIHIESRFQRLLLLNISLGRMPQAKLIARLWRLAGKMPVVPLQSSWAIDEFPWNSKSLRQMRGECFHAENFRRVMSTQEEIHAELFRGNSSPMRRFTGDERVDFFVCDPINLRARGSGHNAYRARLFRTEIENFYRTIQHLS